MDNQANSASVSYKLFVLLAGLATSIIVLVYAADLFAVLNSPYSINFEGPMLWAADALAKGQNIYPAEGLKTAPWICTIYPPLYLLFGAALVKLFGPSYFAMRAANMLFGVGTGILLYRICKFSKLRLAASLSAIVFFFSFVAVCVRCIEVRPDIMQLFFSALMFERCLKLLSEKESNNYTVRRYASVIALAFISICIKQQAIVFIIALLIYLCLENKSKLALKLFVTWFALFAVFSIFMQVYTGAYVENLSFLSVVKPSSEVLIANLGSLGIDWIKVALALVLVPVGVLTLKKIEGVDRLHFLLVFVSTALFFYSMGIPASSASHMMSAFFGLACCLAVCLNRLPDWLGIAFLIASLSSLPVLAEEAIYRPKLLVYAKQDAEKLKQLDLKNKPLLTDDVYLNMLTDSKPELVDCATFLNVWTAEKSDFAQITEPLKQKKYAAVIINSSDSQLQSPIVWWPKAIVKAIHANYERTGELHCSGWSMDLYLPKNDGNEKSSSGYTSSEASTFGKNLAGM